MNQLSENNQDIKPKIRLSRLIFPLLLFLLVCVLVGLAALALRKIFNLGKFQPISPQSTTSVANIKTDMKKFTSETEFKEFISLGQSLATGISKLGLGLGRQATIDTTLMAPIPETAGIDRMSETNVQVKGIDEPDIIKTDGQQIYLSNIFGNIVRPLLMREQPNLSKTESSSIYSPNETYTTKIIKAFPPAELTKLANINQTGELLLIDHTLMVLSYDKIVAYDVSLPASPKEIWQYQYDNNNQLLTARVFQGKIYLVLKSFLDRSQPCPIPLFTSPQAISVRCVDIYHPVQPVEVDVTLTALVLDPHNGNIKQQVSFVGSSGESVVYMSEKSLYVTYTYSPDMWRIMYGFYIDQGADLISDTVKQKLEALANLDISSTAKMTELQIILDKFFALLNQDDRLRVENEVNNRLQQYLKEKARDLDSTGLVKINLTNFTISATGTVGGQPLNQFALDEYQGYLRMATTFGGRWFNFGAIESASDVYILDDKLKITGSVKDLGVGERIYSVRFIADKGYVVTFKQIDPFFVLDLSNPTNPSKKGELKIPGFSSYLHPLTQNQILGVGQEGNQVKLSLFDVSNVTNPVEKNKYLLDEYWTEIQNNHHAFLQDAKHEIFFIPGSKGGYIFSYQTDQLVLLKAVSEISARRAVYINDYLYVVGESKLVVLNENDWTTVNQIDL